MLNLSGQPIRTVINDMTQRLVDPEIDGADRAEAEATLDRSRDLAHQFEVRLKIDHEAVRLARIEAQIKVKDAMDELQAAVKAAITVERREGKADG